MRKVVFLTTIPSPYRVSFFNELGKKCDLTVIFEKNSSRERDKLWDNLNIKNFKAIFLKGLEISPNKAFCPSVISTIKKLPFEVFIVGGYNTPTAMLATTWLYKRKIPYILSADGGYIKNDSSIVFAIKKHFISSAAMWICTSDSTIDYFVHYGANRNKVYKYPFTSVYDCQIIKKVLSDNDKRKYRIQLGISEEKVILSVGRFIPIKGFDVLLKAFNGKPVNTGLYLIGGKETPEYAEIVRDYHLKNVHFIDFITPEKLAEYYKAADLFVFPSRGDVWGLVINEATTYGLPIITTKGCVAGYEMVEGKENGYVTEIDDVEAISGKITEILENDTLRKNMALKSVEVAHKYTFETMTYAHEEIIERFIGIYGTKSGS